MQVIVTWPARGLTLVAALALGAVLPGCGGDDGAVNTPPVTQPPQFVRTLLAEGNFNLMGTGDAARQGFAVDYIRHEFTTSGTALVEVNADWTFASSQMGIVVGRGSCSFAQIDAALAGNPAACPEAGGGLVTSKPARVNIGLVPQNTYTLVILNPNDRTESGVYQVYQGAFQ
jgi:hypothetical protein